MLVHLGEKIGHFLGSCAEGGVDDDGEMHFEMSEEILDPAMVMGW